MTEHTPLSEFELAFTDAPVPVTAIADLDWFPVTVPGEVHASLVEAGRLPHPYLDDNERLAGWVAEKTWWYRTRFASPPVAEDGRLRLDFHGLDTVVTVWLNGKVLGHHENMFRPARFDITDAVRAENELVLMFTPPLEGIEVPENILETARRSTIAFAAIAPEAVEEAQKDGTGANFNDLAYTMRRKPTYSWGWDFAPRLPSVGIWMPVELVSTSGPVIEEWHFSTSAVDLEARTATVVVSVVADGPASVTLTSPTGAVVEGVTVDGRVCFALEDVQPWWTHDLGTPALYDLRVATSGDEVTARVGIRTIELDRSDDPDGGRLFRFVLNGFPVYARGACTVPTTMMLGTTTAQTYRELVGLAKNGNMNMLRVWGGGIYEDDAFYRAADELGILIWQDFLFACMDYPSEEPGFAREVALEADFQVKRLRNHPSLALWAGNNEVHPKHQLVYGDFAPGNWGYGFFHELFPALIAEHSPEIPYWPGSPYGENDPGRTNGVLDGDRHAWEVWHGVNVGATSPETYASRGEAMHFERYKYDTGKFISEFGLHASPARSTLERWISPGQLTLHSPAFDAHIKDTPKRKADDLLAVETGLPTDLDSYVDFTMATQAEGLKYGIEHYRRRQPHNSGALIWQFNDSWPGMSWSIIDHELTPKAAYFFVQRAFAPVIATFLKSVRGLELWVTNSGVADFASTLAVDVSTIDGGALVRASVEARLGPGASVPVWSADLADLGTGPDRVAWVSFDGLPSNRCFFGRLKEIAFPASKVEATVTGSNEITLTADGYSYFTCIEAPDATFSGNYLDLRPGEPVRVAFEGDPTGLSVTSFTNGRVAGE
ncbi:beta-mannosidase [Catenulispora rubra]|uniref:beta-mannosidase n=1 Tax=Catenulispora rubra TaxID=280293 RepID=UPI0018923AC8|nr:glycoside hydrolase family 2 protein [Catenulispora rubra]